MGSNALKSLENGFYPSTKKNDMQRQRQRSKITYSRRRQPAYSQSSSLPSSASSSPEVLSRTCIPASASVNSGVHYLSDCDDDLVNQELLNATQETLVDEDDESDRAKFAALSIAHSQGPGTPPKRRRREMKPSGSRIIDTSYELTQSQSSLASPFVAFTQKVSSAALTATDNDEPTLLVSAVPSLISYTPIVENLNDNNSSSDNEQEEPVAPTVDELQRRGQFRQFAEDSAYIYEGIASTQVKSVRQSTFQALWGRCKSLELDLLVHHMLSRDLLQQLSSAAKQEKCPVCIAFVLGIYFQISTDLSTSKSLCHDDDFAQYLIRCMQQSELPKLKKKESMMLQDMAQLNHSSLSTTLLCEIASVYTDFSPLLQNTELLKLTIEEVQRSSISYPLHHLIRHFVRANMENLIIESNILDKFLIIGTDIHGWLNAWVNVTSNNQSICRILFQDTHAKILVSQVFDPVVSHKSLETYSTRLLGMALWVNLIKGEPKFMDYINTPTPLQNLSSLFKLLHQQSAGIHESMSVDQVDSFLTFWSIVAYLLGSLILDDPDRTALVEKVLMQKIDVLCQVLDRFAIVWDKLHSGKVDRSDLDNQFLTLSKALSSSNVQ